MNATATMANGTAPYLVTFYTNTSGGAYAPAQELLTSGTVVPASFGVLADGLHSIYVRVVDNEGDGDTAYSATNSFTVGPMRYRCVWLASPSPAPPYASWQTAAHTIQEAVDAAQPGETILVNDGVYATGGKAVYGS